MLHEREAEKAAILSRQKLRPPMAGVLPHPTLAAPYANKVGDLRRAPADPAVQTDAVAAIRMLISRVTVP